MAVVTPTIMIDDTFGAAFIGVLLTAMLYGLTNVQTYFYYTYYPKDRTENKLLVASIWLLDSVHMALVSFCMYHYLITNYANPSALASGHWSLFASVAVNIVIALLVHLFFTTRIFRLSNPKIRWYLTGVVTLFVLAQFCFGIVTVVFLFIKKELAKLSGIMLFAAMPFALFAVLSDISIAVSLVVLLWGSRTGFRKTNTLVNTLIIYAVNRCILTSVVAVAEVIAFSISPHSLWFMAIDFVIGKLYANSLLATLNSRNRLRGSSIMNSVHMSDINFEERSGLRTNITVRKEVLLDLHRGESTGSGSRTILPATSSAHPGSKNATLLSEEGRGTTL